MDGKAQGTRSRLKDRFWPLDWRVLDREGHRSRQLVVGYKKQLRFAFIALN
uniref:Uncharacterized protein n=1 Tax=Hyaloperonospora arabidopsidis (strain Emoy2) TaxID=559515 RepID=M4BLC1_HYAAE